MEPMENIRLVLAARMKSRRKSLRLNQDQLAEKAKLSSGMIRNVEIGNRWPSPETLEAIAKGLECTPGELLNEEPVSGKGISFLKVLQMYANIPEDIVRDLATHGPKSNVWENIRRAIELEKTVSFLPKNQPG